jgi:hypothetical protein
MHPQLKISHSLVVACFPYTQTAVRSEVLDRWILDPGSKYFTFEKVGNQKELYENVLQLLQE